MKQPANTRATSPFSYFERKTRILVGIALVATIASGIIDLLAIGGKRSSLIGGFGGGAGCSGCAGRRRN